MKISFKEAMDIAAKTLGVLEPATNFVKLPIDNIVFGRLDEIPLLEMLVNLDVVTKEHIEGTVYDKALYQMVMRIIGGKLLMRGQDLIERPDAYAWKTSKVLKADNKRNLGFHSVEGALTYAEVIRTITDPREKEIFTDLLVKWSSDLLLIHTEKENRNVVIVTEKLIESGIKEVPNSYDLEDALNKGKEVELTPVKAGDALVVEEKPFGRVFYVIQKDEFEMTYARE